MDEEKQLEQNNIDNKLKEAINDELSTYINTDNSEKITSGQQVKIPLEGVKSLKDFGIEENETTESPKIIKPIIRTYKSDAENTIKSGHISSINMAIAESNKMLRKSREEDIESEIKKTKLNKTLIIAGSIFIIGGILAIAIPYVLLNREYNDNVVTEENTEKTLITTDLSEKINIKDLNLNRINTTLKERVSQSSTKLGQIKNFYLTEGEDEKETIITSANFLKLIKTSTPLEIQRTLQTQYMFGMHNFNGNQKFLILKFGSYDIAYSGMLSWETNLWQDFKEIFDLRSEDTATQNYGIEIKKFQDAFFSNKDCRVVKNSSGEIIFLYSIINDETIVITTNVNTLREIINRTNKISVVQ
ncbi:MAG: hypothetical protein WCR40_00715 [Candidatus Paceibacterota bacterium]